MEFNNLEPDQYDSICFVPDADTDEVEIQALLHKERGEKLNHNSVGDMYDIVLFEEDEYGYLINLDRFEAILLSPPYYVKHLIKHGIYGMISRKTTVSKEIVDDFFNKINDYINEDSNMENVTA